MQASRLALRRITHLQGVQPQLTERAMTCLLYTSGFTTNLNGIHGVQGDWSTTSRGYRGNNIGGGDMFAMFTDTVDSSETFVFEGDMPLETSDGIGGLVFGVPTPDDPYSHWYCINVGKRCGTPVSYTHLPAAGPPPPAGKVLHPAPAPFGFSTVGWC